MTIANLTLPALQTAATRRTAAAVAAALAAVGLLLQWTTHLNHDVAWILYSTAEMLDGAVFGRDIIEPNPPLAWLLAMPSAAAWRYLAIPPEDSWRLLVAGLAAGAIVCAWRARRAAGASEREAGLVAGALAWFLFVGCFRDYGQREYLCLALALPYLMLAVARLEGGTARPAAALAIGAAAGLGFALKPYFLAVPLLVEAVGLLRTRRPGFILRGETIGMGFVLAAYAAAVGLLTPGYLDDVVPLVRKIYWAFEERPVAVLAPAIVEIVALAAALGLTLTARRSSFRAAPPQETALQLVLLAAAGGFLVSYILQNKGYSYHLFPVSALAGTSLLLHLASLWPRRARRRKALVVAALCACALFLANAVRAGEWYLGANLATGPDARRIEDMIQLVDGRAADGGFLALATHPFPGFPTALYSQARWVSRTNGTWLVPAIAKLRAAGRPQDAPRLHEIEQIARAMLREELVRARPALVLVDARPVRHALRGLDFDILAFYREDPQFRALWSRYAEQPPLHGFRVFVRMAEP